MIVLGVVGLADQAAALDCEVAQTLTRQLQAFECVCIREGACLQSLYDGAERIGRLLELLLVLWPEA